MSTKFAGSVAAFDAAVGLGEVRRADGVLFPFHCIELADGTRTIEVGTSVVFDVIGKLGRYEAAAISAS